MLAQLATSDLKAKLTAKAPHAAKHLDKVRILHVVASLGVGGTEHGLLKVIEGLGSEEFEHAICAVRAIEESFVEQTKPTKRLYCVGSSKPGLEFPLFRLARIMREFRPHIVHSRNFGALEAVPAAKLAGVPATIHSEHGYELETLQGLPLRRRIMEHAFFKMADAVFTVSDELRIYHARQSWLPAAGFRVLPNGVNTDKFIPNCERGARTRSELGIPQDRVLVGSVGRMVAIKDYGTLLRAAETLICEGRNIHVLLVGAGPELNRLQRQAATSPQLAGRVTFTGVSDRVLDMMNALDVFVLPSISEGMSNTILEAMSSGLPVVATLSGGSPEIIEHDHCGYLFIPRAVETLIQHLRDLADDVSLRRSFGKAARRRAEEYFSLTRMIDRYHDLYRELLAQAGQKMEAN